MKKLAKKLIVAVLALQVKKLRSKNDFKVIVVVGSIGKTSTKLAISQVLSSKLRVRYQEGNYNDLVSVPLVFFNEVMPSIFNPFAWLGIFIRNQIKLTQKYPFGVVVVELGTDGPGQIEKFSKYIEADIAVVTALTPEHMEYFAGIKEVALEELEVTKFSKKLIVNTDLCPKNLLGLTDSKYLTYGAVAGSDYFLSESKITLEGTEFGISKFGKNWIRAITSSFSKPQLYSLTAASLVADIIGLNSDEIVEGYKLVKPVPGRMQLLDGIKGSKLIDDTYNASPDATIASLQAIYDIPAKQRIALLGNMNELGGVSEDAHREIGRYCDPKKLDLIVTLGEDSNKYLAVEAKKKGCKVVETNTPYEAGEVIKTMLKDGSLVLLKGSQNGVFAEEAVKLLLANKSDEKKLVRQSKYWLKVKQQMFK